MFLKACKTSHSCSWSSGRGCSCWCASLPWSTACTTPWSKILLRFLIFLHIQWSDYLVWHRCGDSQNQTFFDQWELRLLPSFILQWDESLQNWTRVVIRSPGSWAPEEDLTPKQSGNWLFKNTTFDPHLPLLMQRLKSWFSLKFD